MIHSIFLENPLQKIPLQKYTFLTQEVIYKVKDCKRRYVVDLTYLDGDNYLMPSPENPLLLAPYEEKMWYLRLLFRIVQEYNDFDKLHIGFNINKIYNLPEYSPTSSNTLVQYMGFIRNFNTFSWGDLESEIDWFYDDKEQENYLNVNLALSFDINKNMKIKIKGENLFDSYIKQNFTVIDPNSYQTTKIPIEILERKISIGMEYTF